MTIKFEKNEILEQIELNKQPLIDNKKLLEEQLHVKVSVEEKLPSNLVFEILAPRQVGF